MSPFSDVKKIETPKPKAPPQKETVHEKQPEPEAKPPCVSWHAPEYIYYEKSSDWFWAFGIITAAFIAIAAWQQSFVFLFLVVVGAFGALVYAVRKPLIVEITISGEGIQIADRLMPYETLESFWIFYRPGGVKELSIKSEKLLMPQLRIPLDDMNPTEVRTFLLDYLPEKAQHESLIDTFARLLRF